MATITPLQAAGKVDIQEITLISGNGIYNSLISYLVELNLYEDIYSGGLYGNIILSDSLGLINKMSIVGEEYITIKFDTPSFNTPIYKTFKCCGVDNRVFTRDTTTESYVIHFVSPEVFLDHYYPVQRAFEGNVDDIVEEIYEKYIKYPRNMIVKDNTITDSDNYTPLCIFTECKKPIKFISPSWSPMKCLSWLASKVVSSDETMSAANFMFFETNKQFYWGSLESMIKEQRESQIISGIYFYTPGNIKVEKSDIVTVDNRMYKNPDISREFFSIHNLTVVNNVNVLQNIQTGYLASSYHELDVTKKTYTENNYDHVARYPFYNHTSTSANGFFSNDTIRNPYAHKIVGFKHTGLFDNAHNNLNEQAINVMPIRNSMMAEMNQVKLKLDVHGRTDVELGSMIYVHYPKSGPRQESDKNKDIKDPFYSGLYIITAIHHRITLESHSMAMEVIKDSFGDITEGNGGV